MTELLHSLVARTRPVTVQEWDGFWDRLRHKELHPGEALATVSALSTRMPQAQTAVALVASLDARREQPASWPGTVNVVGTGGGPATFNLTTASVLVAAATGVKVVKTGSRGYTSRFGSIDLLERLGIPTASSYAECEDMLDAHGIAFADGFVYPAELSRLARAILPYGMKQVGRIFNVLGPFLAAVPVGAQLTGVSDAALVPALAEVADSLSGREVWLLHNNHGVDELIGFARNTIRTGAGSPDLTIEPGTLDGVCLHPGTLAELGPNYDDAGSPVPQLLALLGGDGPDAAVQSICLNAAAAAVASGTRTDWAEAFRVAQNAMHSGAALELVERLRAFRRARSHPAGNQGEPVMARVG
ncbi:anthranilate phosphoribosyltransferase [Streptomyces sp. BA2]|uniref:anthranilate phosphoribosyltransferase n=1 Tax=Streptomyces sp. BA2 TaxID=436595 RepID=UPI00301516C1